MAFAHYSANVGERKTILLAEDTPELLETLRQLLEAAEYSVLCAGSGDVALELLRSHAGPIDILLTDLIMPEVSGADLISAARGMRPTIKILAMSGESRSAAEALRGTPDHLEKPFSGRELLVKLQELRG